MKNLSLIAAVGINGELGIDNHLIWKIYEDLTFYRNMTMGKHIIMGRKTLESMPLKAFEGRYPVVLTRQNLETHISTEIYHDVNKLINDISETQKSYMVVGGASIYEELLPYVDTMYITEIQKKAKADTYFPYFDIDDWHVEEIANFLDNDIPYIRNVYTRKRSK